LSSTPAASPERRDS